MNEYLQVLSGVAPVFLMLAVGAAVRRMGVLNEDADRTLLDLSVKLLAPCIILDHLVANDALRQSGNLLYAPLLGFACTAVSVLLAGLVARLWHFRTEAESKTFTFVGGIYNYGYIPVPLVAAIYGPDALAVLFLYNLGTETAFWTVGFAGFMRHSVLEDWRRTLTAPVRAILLGVVINLATAHFGLKLDTAHLDSLRGGWSLEIILSTLHQIGLCYIPVSMLIIGATMADFWGEFTATSGRAVMILGVALRNFLFPVGMIALAYALPVSRELKETLVVQAAMPAGVLTLLLARHNGGNVPVALQLIFSTSAAAIITLPLWIHFGMLWIGR